MKSVSIVINTYNRAPSLLRTLFSLKYLNYNNFETVVVNGPSDDNTLHVLEKFNKDIKIGNCPVKNLSTSRNIGICMADGDIVAFLDDDGIPEPEWLNDLVEAYDTDEVGGVGGLVYDHTGYCFQYKYSICDRFGNTRYDLKENPTPFYNLPFGDCVVYLQGTNCSFRRDALLQVGGFDEQYDYYLDETDVCLRLIDSGYLIKIIEKGFVHHKFAPSHLRNINKIMPKRFSVTKNHVYFAIKNSNQHHSFHDIFQNITNFIQNQNNHIKWSYENNLITKEEYGQYWYELSEGLKQGFRDALIDSERILIDDERLKVYASPFKLFKTKLKAEKKLSLCFLSRNINPESGGIARFTYALAKGIALKGHDVHLITLGQNFNTVDFEDGVWVHRIVPEKHAVVRLPENFAVSQYNIDYAYAIYGEIKRITTYRKVDFIEAPIWDNEAIVCLLDPSVKTIINLETTLKVALESHEEWQNNPDILKQIEIEKFVLENTKYFHAISNAVVDTIEEKYDLKLDRSLIGVVPLGLPDQSHKYQKQRDDDSIQILFVGRLEYRKGIDILLKAIPPLCQKYHNVVFIIIGDDTLPAGTDKPFKDSFIEKYQTASFIDRVNFLGKVEDEILFQHYADCDIFVAPSRYESFGLIFLEAMMFSKPVIGCNAGGMKEIIEDHKNGFLIPFGNVQSLLEALNTLIMDKLLRYEYGKSSREIYVKKFTDDIMVDNVLSFYSHIIEKGL
jgi:glycosyltransferase involved in cell wall biosynthesis/GT2 family glycosyltransferase